jgi:hypothetical protein
MKVNSIKAVAALLSVSLLTLSNPVLANSPQQTSWELSGEFKDNGNSGPVWEYGFKPTAASSGTSFSVLSNPYLVGVIKGYQRTTGPGLTSLPLIAHNTAMNIVSTPGPQGITLPSRGLLMHPGIDGQVAVVRFKAPYSAQYQISGRFYGLDANGSGTHTNVRIVANYNGTINGTLFSGTIAVPTQNAASFTSKLVMLQAGQTLDFEVAAGTGNNYVYGSTGLHAVIETTSTPWCGPTNPADPSTTTC